MFISAASKTHELLALVPLDLLHDVRSLFSLVSRNGKSLDRQASLHTHVLACFTRQDCCALSGCAAPAFDSRRFAAGARDAGGLLGTRLEQRGGRLVCAITRLMRVAAVHVYLRANHRRGACVCRVVLTAVPLGLSHLIATALQGAVTGTKTLTVRNWFPGMWYVRERKRSGAGSLHLFCQTETGGWTDAGQVRSPKQADTASHRSCTTRLSLAGCFGGGALGAAVSRRIADDRRAEVQRTSP